MNSDKAAAVRDAINGCPEVVSDADVIERSGDPFETSRGSVTETRTGHRLQPDAARFRPAHIEQSGTIGDGNGAERPVFVVVLEPLWFEPADVRSLTPDLTYEIAKHGCGIRHYPEEHRLGESIWITDSLTENMPERDTNGTRCEECESTYYKIHDGDIECARCGSPVTDQPQTTLTEVL